MRGCEVCGKTDLIIDGVELVCHACGAVQQNLSGEDQARISEAAGEDAVSGAGKKEGERHRQAEKAIQKAGKKFYNQTYYAAKHEEILSQKKGYRQRGSVKAAERERAGENYAVEVEVEEAAKKAGFEKYGQFGFDFLKGIVKEKVHEIRSEEKKAEKSFAAKLKALRKLDQA